MAISDLTGTTWTWNDGDISNLESYGVVTTKNINFTSNNETFTSMGFLTQHGGDYNDIRYNNTIIWWSDIDGGDGDFNYDYATFTVTGGTDVTDSTLIGWIEANATQVVPASTIDYDLTQLSLASGTHTITVRAEASGYTDSVDSNSVSYTVSGVQLDAPTILTQSGVSKVYFSPSTDATQYKIYIDGTYFDTFIPSGTGIQNPVTDLEGTAWTIKASANNGSWTNQTTVPLALSNKISTGGTSDITTVYYDYHSSRVYRNATFRVTVADNTYYKYELGGSTVNPTYSYTVYPNTFDRKVYFGGGVDSTDSAFISWITSQATQMTRYGFDLSVMSGWSGLSEGVHTLTIKASAQGYTDSVNSESVTFDTTPPPPTPEPPFTNIKITGEGDFWNSSVTVDGTNITSSIEYSSVTMTVNSSFTVVLNAGWYDEVYVYDSEGGNLIWSDTSGGAINVLPHLDNGYYVYIHCDS